MKLYSLIPTLISIVLFSFNCNAQIVVPNGLKIIDGDKEFSFVKPGDTLFISGNPEYFIIKNLKGNSANPIHITNLPGLVFKIDTEFNYGVSIRNSKYINFFGSNVDEQKGIQIANKTGYGMDVGYLSSNYTIANLEIGPVGRGPGILAKTDPDCSFTSIRANFLQDSSVFKNNYIHDTDTEGIYIGYTFFDGIIRNCGGKDTLLLPHLINNTIVEDNLIVRTGWDAIQLSTTPNAIIRNNKIFNDSQQKTEYQMNGIIMGDGFSGKTHNNLIVNGEGSGLFIKGDGDIVIENNIVLNPGYNNTSESGKYALYIDFSSTNAKSISVNHNLFANPRFEAIRYINPISSIATFGNNIITYNDSLFGNPNALINITDGSATKISNLVISELTANQNFWEKDSLDQKNNAVTINNGKRSNSVFNFDFYGRSRSNLIGSIDIGPFESNITSGVGEFSGSSDCKIEGTDLVTLYDTSFKKIAESINYSSAIDGLSGVFLVLIENKSCIKKVFLP